MLPRGNSGKVDPIYKKVGPKLLNGDTPESKAALCRKRKVEISPAAVAAKRPDFSAPSSRRGVKRRQAAALQVLSAEEFALFVRLRDKRKELTEQGLHDRILPLVAFTRRTEAWGFRRKVLGRSGAAAQCH